MAVTLAKKTATKVIKRELDGREYTAIKYHDTEVVVFSAGAILLDSGGYKTVTTKRRMNQASDQFDLGFQVYQQKKEWFVDFNGQCVRFSDGMVLTR